MHRRSCKGSIILLLTGFMIPYPTAGACLGVQNAQRDGGTRESTWKVERSLVIASTGRAPLREFYNVLTGSDGRVYVPVPAEHVVRVYTESGDVAGELGGEGGGPGEFRLMADAGLRRDTLRVWDHARSRVVLFDVRTLAHLRTRRISFEDSNGGGPLRIRGFLSDGSVLADQRVGGTVSGISEGETGRLLLKLRSGARAPDTLGMIRAYDDPFLTVELGGGARSEIANPFHFGDFAADSPDGEWIAFIREDPARHRENAVVRVAIRSVGANSSVERDLRIVRSKVSDSHIQSWVEAMAAEIAAVPSSSWFSPPPPERARDAYREALPDSEYFPAFSRARITDDGELWLRTSSDLHGAEEWLVLDRQARRRGRLQLPRGMTLVGIESGDRIWTRSKNELDVPSLVRLRVIR